MGFLKTFMGEWSVWLKFSEGNLEKVPNSPGVYEIRYPSSLQRFLDKDNDGILTIGESSNLYERIKNFWESINGKSGSHSEGNTFYFLHLEYVFDLNRLEFRYKETKDKEEAELEECKLLDEYEEKYGELPPLNRHRGKTPNYVLYLYVKGGCCVEIKRGNETAEIKNILNEIAEIETLEGKTNKKYLLTLRVNTDKGFIWVDLTGSDDLSTIIEKLIERLKLSPEKVEEIRDKIKWWEERPKRIKEYLGLE